MSQFSKSSSVFRLVFAALLVAVTMTVATTSPTRVAKADSGEAAFDTKTQALQSALSVGDRHTCAISNGNLLCWGDNTNGQLGNGQSGIAFNNKPVYVKDSQANSNTNLSGVIAVVAATEHTCALINTGMVKCWGVGSRVGRFGMGGAASPWPAYVKSAYTTQVESNASADLTNVVGLTASTYNTCALISDGKIKCWGDTTGSGKNNSGVGYVRLCINDLITVPCSLGPTVLTNAKQVNMSGQTSCAIRIDETQACWGNNNGVYGYTTTSGDRAGASSASPTISGAKALGTGTYTGCGLYQIGITPVSVTGGQVKCWGANASLGLGRGTSLPNGTGTAYEAENVGGLSTAIVVSGQESTFCALLMNTTVKCWGDNLGGKTVNATNGDSVGTPLPMKTGDINSADLSDIYAVSVGAQHICIITGVSGNVKCSGSNANGQRGDGSATATAVSTMQTVKDTSGTGDLTGAGADVMPPEFVSSAINGAGTKLILMYAESLSGSSLPTTSSFTVKVDGVLQTVSSINVSGSTVELVLAERVAPSAAVLMSYTDPTANVDDTLAIQDASYNDAATISERAVTNSSTADVVRPILVSAAVNSAGTKLRLTYDETLNATTATANSFAVTIASSVRSDSSVATSGSVVELTLSGTAVQIGEAVTVAYTAPTSDWATSNAAVQDTAGNDAATFSANTVTVSNGSLIDSVAPIFVSGAVSGDKAKVILTYNEALNATTAVASRFLVDIGGGSRAVTSVAVDGVTVELTLVSPVIPGDVVKVDYTAPTVSALTTNLAVQDTAGNDAASITPLTVVANIEDTTVPTFVGGAVNTGGALVLTYNETLGGTGPATTDVRVTINGVDATIVSVTIVGSTVVVVTSPVIGIGDVVTFAYTDPTAGNDSAAIQDAAGNDMPTTGTPYSVPGASNNSTVDTAVPTFIGGAVNGGGKLVLTYSETLGAVGPGASAVTVVINGVTVAVTDVVVVGSTIVITTSPLIEAGDVVTYSYTDPTAGNDVFAIQDAAGNDFSTTGSPYSVPGGSNSSIVDFTKPSAPVGVGIDGDGVKVTMTFSEDMSATLPGGSDFVVTVDGVDYTVTKVEVVGKDVVLTVTPSVKSGQKVTISYVDPSAGNDTNGLQDSAGNDVSSFSGASVVNSSVQASAVNQVDAVLDTTLPVSTPVLPVVAPALTTPVVAAPVSVIKVVDGDAASTSTSMSETKALTGKSGTAKFSDGSSFGVSKNGNLIPKLFTAYIGTVTGSVKVTYKVGKKTTSVSCSYGKYGSTKAKKVTKSQNGWYPKAFIAPKKSCKMPVAAIKALNSQMVTISASLKFVRLWPTTGKPKNPQSGATLRPVNRKYSVKIGTAPK